MTNRQQKKIRYVKCPKCARILPEPEEVPLYTCGGCDTTLLAKYYRRHKEALVASSPKDVVQRIGNGHTSDVGESSGLSLRSSGEQSSVQNEESNEKAVNDCNAEQIGDEICSRQTSPSEESSVLGIKGGNQLIVPREESGENPHGDKEAEKLPMENGTRDDGSDQDLYDGVEVEKQDDEQISKVNNTGGIATKTEFEALENRQPLQVSMVNETKQGENDKQKECEDVTDLEKRKVGHESPAKKASMTIQSQFTEKPMQFGPVIVAGGDISEYEAKKMDIGGELFVESVSGSEIDCLSEDKPVEIAKLGKKDKNGKEQKSFIERMREKLATVTILNDTPTSTQVEDRNGDTLPRAYASHSTYAPSGAIDSTSSYAPQDPDCEISLSDNVEDTSRQKIENTEDTASNEVEKEDDEQVRQENNACGISTKREFEVLENRQPQQVSMVNEMKQDEIDKQGECEDITALEKQKVGHKNPAKEASMMIQSQPAEKPMQFEPVNGGGISEHETKKMDIGGELCVEGVSGSEFDCISEDKPVEIAKLGKKDNDGKEQKFFIERMQEKLVSVTISNDTPTSTQVGDRNEDTLPGAYASHSAYAPSGAIEKTSSYAPQDPDCEISLSDNVKDTSRQKIEKIEDTATNESANKADTSEPVDMREKVGNLVEDASRSPTKRSPAYDGSVSSCDGNDDRVPEPPEHLNGGPFSENDVPPSRINHGISRTRAQVKSFSCQLSDDKLKRSSVRENDNQGYHRTMQARDGLFPPRVPFQRKSSEMAFETGSSSSYVHDEGPNRFTRDRPYRYVDQEPWSRKTYRDRGYMEGRRFPEASWRENDLHPPIYYNDDISGELYQKERYYGHNDRRRRAESLSLSGNLPQTRYSGEMYNGSYMHHPHDARPWSAQLPSHPPRGPPASFYRHGPVPYMDPSREASWDPYDPYPTNPQRYLDFDPYGWAHDATYLSDDQRHKEWITKRLYMREKRQAVKRHLRPMAGGAPFITCRFCFKVLQLPVEFLVSKRRTIHKLKCGVCSNVLEFSLGNDSCLAPHFPCAGESGETNLDSFAISASSSRHNSFRSVGGEKVKSMSSNSRTREKLDESSERASPSDQSRQVAVTWKLPPRSKSPLHRLMGYSSAQDLLAENTVDDRVSL